MRGVPLMLLTLLGACASRGPATDPGGPTGSTRAACLALGPIAPNRGKPGGASTEDVAGALDRDRPLAQVRNLVGDTDGTLRQVDAYNAARRALCGGN